MWSRSRKLGRALQTVRAVLAAASTVGLYGCGQEAAHAFVTVQACLLDERGGQRLAEELREIARTEQMDFVDSSELVAERLREVSYPNDERTAGSRTLHVVVERADGVGVTAANTGLPGFEVALGFTEGADAAFARAFADRVLLRLSAQWQLDVVPPGVGAKPKGDCP